jgi:hypothetical protein
MSHDDGKRSAGWLIDGCFAGSNIPIVTATMGVDANSMPLPLMGSVKPWVPGILMRGTLMTPV